MIQIGVIGCGYWGPNYVRVFNELSESRVKWCCDLDKKNLENIKKLYPEIKVTRDYKEVAKDSEVDAAVIVTPVKTHYQVAKHFLKEGKHLLVEKPFTNEVLQAKELIKIAKAKHLVLMVGHVYLYNAGIRMLEEIIRKKELGKIYYLKAERIGLGPIRKQASALWDLAIHDIYIALYLLKKSPLKVSAEGNSFLQKGIEDSVNLNLKFHKNIFCTIYANWFAPEKVRKLTVVGSRSMAVFDDVNKQEMLKIYERKINKKLFNSTPEYSDHQNIVTIGDVYIPNIKQSEPLKNQAKHFLECISENKEPLTDAQDGLNVVKILEAVETSIKKQ